MPLIYTLKDKLKFLLLDGAVLALMPVLALLIRFEGVLPDRELALLGKKKYIFGSKRVLSTYIQTDAMTPVRLGAIMDILRTEIKREEAVLWVYLVHDPVRMRSTEYDLAPDGQIRTIRYDYLASRGKDVMPRVEREMRKEEA